MIASLMHPGVINPHQSTPRIGSSRPRPGPLCSACSLMPSRYSFPAPLVKVTKIWEKVMAVTLGLVIPQYPNYHGIGLRERLQKRFPANIAFILSIQSKFGTISHRDCIFDDGSFKPHLAISLAHENHRPIS